MPSATDNGLSSSFRTDTVSNATLITITAFTPPSDCLGPTHTAGIDLFSSEQSNLVLHRKPNPSCYPPGYVDCSTTTSVEIGEDSTSPATRTTCGPTPLADNYLLSPGPCIHGYKPAWTDTFVDSLHATTSAWSVDGAPAYYALCCPSGFTRSEGYCGTPTQRTGLVWVNGSATTTGITAVESLSAAVFLYVPGATSTGPGSSTVSGNATTTATSSLASLQSSALSGKKTQISVPAQAGIGIAASASASIIFALLILMFRRRSKNRPAASRVEQSGYTKSELHAESKTHPELPADQAVIYEVEAPVGTHNVESIAELASDWDGWEVPATVGLEIETGEVEGIRDTVILRI